MIEAPRISQRKSRPPTSRLHRHVSPERFHRSKDHLLRIHLPSDTSGVEIPPSFSNSEILQTPSPQRAALLLYDTLYGIRSVRSFGVLQKRLQEKLDLFSKVLGEVETQFPKADLDVFRKLALAPNLPPIRLLGENYNGDEEKTVLQVSLLNAYTIGVRERHILQLGLKTRRRIKRKARLSKGESHLKLL